MLILARMKGEEIVIAFPETVEQFLEIQKRRKRIVVKITGVDGQQVRVGIDAPLSCNIYRRELEQQQAKCEEEV